MSNHTVGSLVVEVDERDTITASGNKWESKQKIEGLETLLDKQEKEQRQFEVRASNAEREQKSLARKTRKLGTDLARREEEVKSLRRELKTKSDTIGKEMEKLCALLDRQKKEYKELEDRVSITDKERERLGRLKSGAEKELAGKEKEVEKLREELSVQTNTVSELNTKLVKADKKASLLQQELQQATSLKTKVEGEREELEAELEKTKVDMHYKCGLVYQKAGNWNDAEREYLRVLSLVPDSSSVHYNLGILYDDSLNKKKKAIYHYQKYIELCPQAEDVSLVKKWILRAGGKPADEAESVRIEETKRKEAAPNKGHLYQMSIEEEK